MIDVAEALRILEQASAPLDVVESDLTACLGHGLAEAAAADRDFPAGDRSAMDGYAVRSEDAVADGSTLRLVGEVRAGVAATQPLGPGEAIRIFTGAALPPGADAVVMVERTVEDATGNVRLERAVAPGAHVRRRGEEFRAGDEVLQAGTPLGAAEVAALASIGLTTPRVHRAPSIRLLATGDELVPPEETPLPHQVRNSNLPALASQLQEMGLVADELGVAPDRADALGALLERGLAGDVLLVTGGVSVGRYDLVGAALERAGMQTLFHRVAVKPGKPLLAGRAGRCLIFGLPGNPISAFSGFVVFVAPVLRRMLGHRAWRNETARARLTTDLRVRGGRQTYHLARIVHGASGLEATPVVSAGSGDVLSLARANGYVITAADVDGLAEGAPVTTLRWPGPLRYRVD